MFINSVLIKNVNLSKHTPFFFTKPKLKSPEILFNSPEISEHKNRWHTKFT